MVIPMTDQLRTPKAYCACGTTPTSRLLEFGRFDRKCRSEVLGRMELRPFTFVAEGGDSLGEVVEVRNIYSEGGESITASRSITAPIAE